MKRLTEADQPLYGRRTGLLQVDPFDYRDVGQCVSNYTAPDKIRVYGMFGGLPGHLALIQDSRSLIENASRVILKPTGRI